MPEAGSAPHAQAASSRRLIGHLFAVVIVLHVVFGALWYTPLYRFSSVHGAAPFLLLLPAGFALALINRSQSFNGQLVSLGVALAAVQALTAALIHWVATFVGASGDMAGVEGAAILFFLTFVLALIVGLVGYGLGRALLLVWT